MTYHIAICDDDSRDAGYVSELLHQWAQLRGCAVTEQRSFDRLKRRDPIWGPAASACQRSAAPSRRSPAAAPTDAEALIHSRRPGCRRRRWRYDRS